jgi:hypothetical protein
VEGLLKDVRFSEIEIGHEVSIVWDTERPGVALPAIH